MPEFKIGKVVKTNAQIVSYFKIVSMIKRGYTRYYQGPMTNPRTWIDFSENEIEHLTKQEEKIFVKSYK